MQACPYQDSKKSRIGTRISAILHLIIKSFNKRLGSARRTGSPQALIGGVISAVFLCAISKLHPTAKGRAKCGSEDQIKIDRAALPIPRSEWVSHRYKIQAESVFLMLCCGDSYGEPSRISVGEPQRGLLPSDVSRWLCKRLRNSEISDWASAKRGNG